MNRDILEYLLTHRLAIISSVDDRFHYNPAIPDSIQREAYDAELLSVIRRIVGSVFNLNPEEILLLMDEDYGKMLTKLIVEGEDDVANKI